ncbi:MAG: molecular chaperone DnaJ [Vicinamibacterales bacterium]
MDFYLVLGLTREATLGDIKRAYRRLARRYHPDINPGDRVAAAEFRRIAEAYETLSDPARRTRYDTSGGLGSDVEPASAGFEGFDFSVRVGGATASTFGDLFADVLKSRYERPPAGPERGADLHQQLTCTFEDAFSGKQHSVAVTRQEPCRTCLGDGVLRPPNSVCGVCQGRGTLRSARGHMVFSKPCGHCRGTGRAEHRCPGCNGQQIEMRSETLTVTVPPGLQDGSRIRVAGKGHAGRKGGEPGDLYLTVRVEAHPFYKRDGDDLHLVVPVAIHEAALGAKVEIPAPDGHAWLRVPPGTQSGQRFRLRERGVPSVRDGRRGDLVVEVRIVLPRLLDERSKELIREFGRLNTDDVRGQMPGRVR